jgi:hypothetical protein
MEHFLPYTGCSTLVLFYILHLLIGFNVHEYDCLGEARSFSFCIPPVCLQNQHTARTPPLPTRAHDSRLRSSIFNSPSTCRKPARQHIESTMPSAKLFQVNFQRRPRQVKTLPSYYNCLLKLEILPHQKAGHLALLTAKEAYFLPR